MYRGTICQLFLNYSLAPDLFLSSSLVSMQDFACLAVKLAVTCSV